MKKKNLSKLIALSVLLGVLSYSSDVRAETSFTLANETDGTYFYGEVLPSVHYSVFGNSSDGKQENITTNFSGNTVTIYNSKYIDTFYGAYNKITADAVSRNKIYFNGGGKLDCLYGGSRNNAGDVGGNSASEGNSVIITGEKLINVEHSSGHIYGGYGNFTTGNVGYNSVYIYGDPTNYSNYIREIVGGNYGEKNFNNSVNIYGGFFSSLYGGFSSGELYNNSVNIYGGKLGGDSSSYKYIIGAECNGLNKNVYGNTVFISDSASDVLFEKFQIIGGLNIASNNSNTAIIKSNFVHIESGTFTGSTAGLASYIYGGEVYRGGTAGGSTPEEGNKVLLDGGIYENISVVGGSANNEVQNNSVEITNNAKGNFRRVYGGELNVQGTKLLCSYNKVTTYGVDIQDLVGGSGSSGNECSYNSVYVNGGNINNVIGAQGGKNRSFNSVIIEDGIFNNVHAAYSTSTGTSNNNTVDIRGGIFNGEIVATTIEDYNTIANNNVVKISGGLFNKGVKIYGIQNNYSSGANTPDDNKLIVDNHKLSANSINGFQCYEFNIGNSINKGDIILNLVGQANITDAKIDVVINEALGEFEVGEKIVLINKRYGSPLSFNIYTDYVGGTPYTGNAEIICSGSQLLLGNLKPDYTIQNNTGLIVNYESGTDGNYSNKIIGNSSDGTESTSNNNDTDNIVVINQGNYSGVYGSYSQNDPSKRNIVNVYGGKISTIYGGYSPYDEAGGADINDGNSVIINASNMLDSCSSVYGGYGVSALNNKVKITAVDDSHINSKFTYVYGGSSLSGSAEDNIVIIEAGTFGTYTPSKIYGGYSSYGGEVKNNIVDISGGEFENEVEIYGGFTTGTSTGNKLILRKKKLDIKTMDKFQEIDLCLGDKITKEDGNTAMINTTNAIDISDVSINVALNGIDYDIPENEGIILLGKVSGVSSDMNIYTGEIGGEIYSADDLKIVVSGEKVLLGNYIADYTIANDSSTPQISFKSGFLATGAYTSEIQGNVDNDGTTVNGNYSDNEVSIYLGEYNTNIYGAKSTGSDDLAENKVCVKGGTFTGHAVYGAYSNGNVSANSVEISDGLFKDAGNKVYGGYSANDEANNNYVKVEDGTFQDTEIYGGYSAAENADNNKVEIVDGDFSTGTVKIVGGGVGDTTKTTNNNIVGIAGGTFGSNVSLIGGQGASTGNKLEYRVSGQTFNSVRDFQEMNFYLPTDTDVTGATPLMTVTNEVTVDAIVNVYNPNNIALADGDIVTLIHDTSGNKFQDTFTEMQGGNVLGQTMNISGTKFVNQYAELGFDDDTNPTKLQMKVQSAPEVTTDEDVLKAPVEGMAAAAQAVNTVSDLASTQGMENMTNVTSNSETAESFAASNIGKQKLKSGSHVDVHGYALVAGVAKKTTNDNGDKVTAGLFFEYGNNDFDTYQDNGYHGEGSSVSRGGGLMWKYESVNGSYYEGMLHAGRVKTNWKSNELNGGYETNSIYYGGAATYGYKLMMEEREQLKFYASYMYGHTADSDVNVGGADYHFDSVKSHRTRLGVRYMHSDLMEQNKVRPYIGFAWEHEFDGEARADVSVGSSTISAPAPTMKGNTGIMDIGCTWDTGRWTVSLGGEMYVGKRRGWNGMLSFTLNF